MLNRLNLAESDPDHRNRGVVIGLAQSEKGEVPGHGSLFICCSDADLVAEEWRQAEIEVNGPRNEDYGKREGSITDPDGNLIRFGSPIYE